MAVSRNRKFPKDFKLFKGKVPKAPVERGIDEGIPFVRTVDHVKSKYGRQYVYHPTKGWSRVRYYAPQFLLNSVWMKAGFPNLYQNA